jgi:glycosidase
VQTCELDNLAEYVVLPIPVSTANSSSSSLATETEYVRGRLATYVNDLLSLGVDGLRLDAAKREWSI